MASLRDIFVRLGLKTDPSGFRKANQGISQIKDSALSLGRVIATGAVAVGFKRMIDVASDIEETANKFGAVFGTSGGNVQAQLDAIRQKTGATNLQLQEMSSGIGALIKPALGSAAAAGDMAASVSGLALDISSFNNVSSDEAIIALRSALIGSAEPMQRFGVDTRVAAIEQEALRQGITKSYQAMTEGERIQLRFATIQRQLGDQGATGDATRTAEGFANASRNLAAAMKETAGIIGRFFLGVVGKAVLRMREVTDAIQQWVRDNRQLIQQGFDRFAERVGRVVAAVGDFASDAVAAFNRWRESIGPVGQQILKITGIVLALAAVLMLPGVPILALIALVGLLIEDFQKWRAGGESVIGDIIGWFESLIAVVGESVDAFRLWFREHETGITAVTSMVAGLATVITGRLIVANKAAVASFLGLNTAAGKWIRFHILGAKLYVKHYLTAAKTAVLTARVWAVSAAKTMARWVVTMATMNRAQWRWFFLGLKINTGYYLMSAKRAAMTAAAWVASAARASAAWVASAARSAAAWVASAAKTAAAWLVSTAPLILTAALLSIIVGTLIFLGAELVKLAKGQGNFFSTMADGFGDLRERFGGIAPAIGEMLQEAGRFWVEFFGGTREQVDEFVNNALVTLRELWDNVLEYWTEKLTGWWKRWGDFIDFGFGEGDEGDAGPATAPRTRGDALFGRGGSPTTNGPTAPVLATLPAEIRGGGTIGPRAGAALASGPSVVDNRTENINVSVAPGPGMDERKLAELTAQEIARALEAETRIASQSFALEAP